jgi:hypothetical protein
MATNTTNQSDSHEPAEPAALAQLWQVPVFLAGLVAVIGLGAAIPLEENNGTSALDRQVVRIRRALAEPRGCPANVLAMAQQLLARTDQEPQRAGEAHFLLGSIYLRLADHCRAERVPQARQKALFHLEQAEKRGVPEDDREKLAYRLGKALAQAGSVPARAAAYLARSVAVAADDPAEGYRLLVQAYLDQPAPDLEAAFNANLKLLALPTDDEKILGPARLVGGEILLRQKKPAEALKMLASIGAGAPTPVRARGRLLQARCCQRLHLWDRAIPAWQEVLRGGSLPAAERGPILYALGLCHHNLEPPNDGAAAQVWEKATACGGDSGQAAALRLAELRLQAAGADGTLTNPDGALAAYHRALDGIKDPAGYHNSLVDLARARRLAEWGCHVYLSNHHFERCLQLAELYRKLAPPGVAEDLEGQAAEAWARDLQANGGKAQRGHMRAQFLRAGASFERAAAVRPEAERPGVLWHSVRCYRGGGHYDRVAAVLEKFVACKVSDEQHGEGWFVLAEARLVLGQKSQARAAYYKAIEYPGPFAYRAQYQLALAELTEPAKTAAERQARLKQAEDILDRNRDPKVAVLAPDAHEKSLFLLADLLFRRRDYDLAAVRLQEAIELYPANRQIVQARDQLADCSRRQADQEIEALNNPEIQSNPDQQPYHRRRKNEFLERAARLYGELADDLDRRQSAGRLPPAEQVVLRKARFAVAECLFDQGDYREALRLARDLAERRYAGKVESLYAYQIIWRCACASTPCRVEDARDALKNADAALRALPDAAFQGTTGSRKEWQQWITSRAAQLPR